MNTIKRTSITINLFDENQCVAMSWKLTNAFPVKITLTHLNSDVGLFAIESMEVAYVGLSIVS